MKKSKKLVLRTIQWEVVKGVTLSKLARTCEAWTEKGWDVHTILGPLGSGFIIVLTRIHTE